jgi:copper chaperone NosL
MEKEIALLPARTICYKELFMKSYYKWPRLLVLFAALLLAGAIFFPLWQIQLSAPQYPEGLTLKIYAKGLAGDVDVVNGLNHYIGMQTLHNEDFLEFTLLPYIIGSLVLFGLLAAFINKKSFYTAYITLFLLVAIISMIDFYRWEYNYGHNLDPNAAIQVPGMSYQPPLIGYKQLLNFGAYSIPDVGGWLFVTSGILLFIAFLLLIQPKWLSFKKNKIVVTAVIMVSMQSCSSGPQPIKYEIDACDFCKMTIMQKKFANEWVTDKGKVFRFDDVHCLLSFRKTNESSGTAYINDFNEKKELVKADNLFFVKSTEIKTPMGGHIAAFTDKVSSEEFAKNNAGQTLMWKQIEEEFLK